MKKKKYPLEVIKLIDKITSINYNFISIKIGDRFLLELKDIDNESDFFFTIESFSNHTIQYDHESFDTIDYRVSRKPKNEIFENETTEEISYSVVLDRFDKWLEIIKQYNNIDLTPKDQIVLFYENEFYNNFKIVDPDADTNPFNLKQQIAISEHIDFIIEILSDTDDDLSKQIINESSQLKKDLTTKNKNLVFKQLCKIWGMTRKHGIDIFKLVMTKGFDKLVELSVSKGFHELLDLF